MPIPSLASPVPVLRPAPVAVAPSPASPALPPPPDPGDATGRQPIRRPALDLAARPGRELANVRTPEPARRPELDHDLAKQRLAAHLAPPAHERDPVLGQAGGEEAAKAAARAQYRAGGRRRYDLHDREQVQKLISASPQIDDLKDTKADQHRCGAAAAFNALLLDGRPAENAEALARTAQTAGRSLSELETRALDRMRQGTLSPNEAARLQEVVYDSARRLDGDASGDPGLRGREIAVAVSHLRANGGLANTTQLRVAFNDRFEGRAVQHANLLHQDRAGQQAFVDAWPTADGRATLRPNSPGPGGFIEGGYPSEVLSGDYTFEPRAYGNYHRLRFARRIQDPDAFTSYHQRELVLPPGVPLDAAAAADRQVVVPYR